MEVVTWLPRRIEIVLTLSSNIYPRLLHIYNDTIVKLINRVVTIYQYELNRYDHNNKETRLNLLCQRSIMLHRYSL